MRRFVLLAAVLAGTAACGSTGQAVGTATTGRAGTTVATALSSSAPDNASANAQTDDVSLDLLGRWEATSPTKFCPVGMAIGATSTEPPSDAVDLSLVDEITFADGTVTLTSECGEISDYPGAITRCTGSYRVTDISGSQADWRGQLGVDTFSCAPPDRTFDETEISVSGDRLQIGEITFDR